MYISYVTYIVLLALLLIGGKFAKGKGALHEDSTSLEVTKCLRGFAAFGVILHHISQQHAFQSANGWGKPGELSIFVNAGFFFVAIFFFCSGFGLIKSLNTKENYLDGFIKNRIVKTIVIPFYVNVVLYAIFNVVTGAKIATGRWICNFLGLTLMNEYAWYPIVLTILYFAFYFIFKNVKNRKVCFLLMFLVIIGQGVFFSFNGHFAWWAGPKNWWLNSSATRKWWMENNVIWFFGEWWVNSSIAFLIGMIFAQNEEKIRSWFAKLYPLKLLLVFVLFIGFNFLSSMAQWKCGYWSEWNGKGPGILNKLICYGSQLPQVSLFVILIFAIMLKYYVKNPVLKFFGNISYETYMMNLMALNILSFLLTNSAIQSGMPATIDKMHLAINEVSVIALTIALAFVYKWLNKLVTKLILKKK